MPPRLVLPRPPRLFTPFQTTTAPLIFFPLSSHCRSMASSSSSGTAIARDVAPLLRASGGKWTPNEAGTAIGRTFRFKTFAKTWDFMTAVALQCKLKNHHPEWFNVYNTAYIRWTTHSTKGLSALDVAMARACDALAEDFGVLETQAEGEDDVAAAGGGEGEGDIRSMLDRASDKAGDCCGGPVGKKA